MRTDTIELVERVRRRLKEHENACEIAGPVPETAISAAEQALGITFPPSYRTFLRTFGGIAIPAHLGVVHDFVGVAPDREPAPGTSTAAPEAIDDVDATLDEAAEDRPRASGSAPHAAAAIESGPDDVVGRTLTARQERKLADHLVVVGMGAQYQEWFCLDVSRPKADGEYPVLLYDARENAVDQQFYDDFGQMLDEVMGFVADSLDQPLD